jgi:hypothetical protein
MQQTGRTSRSSCLALCLALIALLVGTAACRNEPPAREFDPKDVLAAGSQAIEHGQDMQQLGARMVDHGQAINDPGWVSDGQHWIADGNSLVETGERAVKLGQSLRGNPVTAREVDLYQVRAEGLGLISAGQALVDHGKVMIEFSELLRRRAEAGGDPRLAQDVADSSDRAQRMGQSGQQLVASGQQLVDFADTLAKSLGR